MPGCRALPRHASDRADVLRLRALLALGDVELHLLAFLQLTVALAGDVGVVGEDVGATALLLNEAEALLAVEPLDCALGHGRLLRGKPCAHPARPGGDRPGPERR